MNSIIARFVAFLLLLTVGTGYAAAQGDETRIKSIAEHAYTFGFPIVMSYKTWYFFFIDEENPQFVAPMGYRAATRPAAPPQ